jgi:engulfment and cell motility protein 2
MSEAQKLQDAESVKLVYKNCSQRCSTSCKLSPKELLALNTLRSQSRLEFNKANQSHQSLLSQFYETVFPNEDLPINNQSENWKKIGFQNKDPGSDFRGAGVFGLEQLLYLSTTYPKEFREIIENSSTYSFAISALNITVINT